ncbi:putative tRNAHis guanylyltransferase, partial [Catenaria anguillulae PL171]
MQFMSRLLPSCARLPSVAVTTRLPPPQLAPFHIPIRSKASSMAKSKYEYVKLYEPHHTLLPNTWVVVRVDGKGFHKFSKQYNFDKPNDEAALQLMNYAASKVMESIDDLTLAYGQSDEYSFLFRRSTDLYCRREIKLASVIGSMFTAHYIHGWSKYFPSTPLTHPPVFDSRAVPYPTRENVRDYFSWRQADCHINNLNNTVFWALVLRGSGMTEHAATMRLQKTNAKEKNEILFSEFGINYNNEPERFRKGTTLFKEMRPVEKESVVPAKHADPKWPVVRHEGENVVQIVTRQKSTVVETTEDIIGDAFWEAHPQAI